MAGPSRRLALGMLVLAGVLVVVALSAAATGRLLALPGAALLGLLGLRDLLWVPVLRADADGLTVRTGPTARRLPWAQVARLRVVTDRRAVLLEIEAADEQLLLLSRARLGRDPRDVLAELERLRS